MSSRHITAVVCIILSLVAGAICLVLSRSIGPGTRGESSATTDGLRSKGDSSESNDEEKPSEEVIQSASSSPSEAQTPLKNERKGIDEEARKVEELCEQYRYSSEDYTLSIRESFDLMENGYTEETPKSDTLHKLWESREFDEVRKISATLLASDDSDLVGLLIEQEWASLNVDLNRYYSLSIRILESAKHVETSHFAPLRPALVAQIEKSIPALEARTPEEIAEFQRRARVKVESKSYPSPPLTSLIFIQALELDGLFVSLKI